MSSEFIKKWLSERNNQIKDHLNEDDGGLDFQQSFEYLKICFPPNHSNPIKIAVYQSSENLLKNIISIDNDSIFIYPISKNVQPEINSWRSDGKFRANICKEWVEKLSLLKNCKLEQNLKFEKRIKALKSFLNEFIPWDHPLPKINHYQVFKCNKNSLLTCLGDILPSLISGIPIIIVTNLYFSFQIAFLRDLFVHCGAPENVFQHLIDFKVSYEGQIGGYMLTENADIYSSLDNIFDTYITSNLACIKVFAQESLKSKIERIVKQRLKDKYTKNLLFDEMELFYIYYKGNMDDMIDVEALGNIDDIKNGIWFYYYRHNGESITMINRFMGSKQLRTLSIWSEDIGMAQKVARKIEITRNISINCSNIKMNKNNPQWPLELITHEYYSLFTMQGDLNLKKPNPSWPTLNNRRQILIDMLDKQNIVNGHLVRLNIECHLGNHYEENLKENLLRLDYKSPLGNIIIYLKNNTVSPLLSIFCFQLLLDGNFLILIGTKDMLRQWKPMAQHLNANQNVSLDVLQLIECNNGDEKLKWTNNDNYEGAVLLFDHKRQIQSLFIDQSQFNEDHYWLIFEWLRGRQCSISIALQEYEMEHIVE